MICIKTVVKPSNISGLGLFADEDIPKGSIIWRFNPIIDKIIPHTDLENLNVNCINQIKKYAYIDVHHFGLVLCGDDARFLNHSTEPNCNDSMDNITFTIRDIKKGEELTVDYNDFYLDFNESLL